MAGRTYTKRAGPGEIAMYRVPAMLEDLVRIGTACVTTDPVLSKIPGLVFNRTAALTRSADIARKLARAG